MPRFGIIAFFHTFETYMFLKKISILGFKNIRESSLEFRSRINCFVGDNGAGKTNVLDAVHYLSMCKGAVTMTDAQCVSHGGDFFVVDGTYAGTGGKKDSVVCSFKKGGGKTVKRNGKEYEKLSDHIGLVPVVIVSPSDSFLITDAADERRRYLNSFLSQLDKAYLKSIVRYNGILAERNKLLKTGDGYPDPEVMGILDMQLVEAGEIVHGMRAALIEKMAPVAAEFYRELSEDKEQVELVYHSELNDTPFADLLSRSAEKDRYNQFTTCGVHRDDLKMKIGGYPLKKYGSQGQQKSFLIALKLAQYRIVSEAKGDAPILLLDDLFDKLDTGRVEKLLGLVSNGEFGQIFITDCNKARLEDILKKGTNEYTLFNVESGNISEL